MVKSNKCLSKHKLNLSLCKVCFTFVKKKMKTHLLLSHKYKKAGWIILIPSVIMGLAMLIFGFDRFTIPAPVFAIYSDTFFESDQYFQIIQSNILPTLTGLMFLIGALLVCFSKEKNEDEFIAGLRLSSLLWAVLINYILLILAFLFIYGIPFLSVMLYNMFTVLIIFIARFNYLLYRNSKSMSDEE